MKLFLLIIPALCFLSGCTALDVTTGGLTFHPPEYIYSPETVKDLPATEKVIITVDNPSAHNIFKGFARLCKIDGQIVAPQLRYAVYNVTKEVHLLPGKHTLTWDTTPKWGVIDFRGYYRRKGMPTDSEASGSTHLGTTGRRIVIKGNCPGYVGPGFMCVLYGGTIVVSQCYLIKWEPEPRTPAEVLLGQSDCKGTYVLSGKFPCLSLPISIKSFDRVLDCFYDDTEMEVYVTGNQDIISYWAQDVNRDGKAYALTEYITRAHLQYTAYQYWTVEVNLTEKGRAYSHDELLKQCEDMWLKEHPKPVTTSERYVKDLATVTGTFFDAIYWVEEDGKLRGAFDANPN